jgi:hypothetical protein
MEHLTGGRGNQIIRAGNLSFMQKEAAQGNKTFQSHPAAGHHLIYRDDMAFLHDNQAQIIQGLL